MYDPYAFDSYFTGLDDSVIALFVGIYMIMMAFGLMYSIFVYILNSVGMYSIAKRRGIHHAWLAWIPIGNVWILGCVSDQYQYVVKGRNRSRRKLLLGLQIGMYAAMVPFYIVYYRFMNDIMYLQDPMEILSSAMGMLLLCLVIMAISIVVSVFTYMAYYDLFVSSRPKSAVAFLVLGIIFSFLLPYFVFACRKKDDGMPPRRDSAQQQTPIQPQRIAPAPQVPSEPVAQPEQPSPEPQADVAGDVIADESDFEPEE